MLVIDKCRLTLRIGLLGARLNNLIPWAEQQPFRLFFPSYVYQFI